MELVWLTVKQAAERRGVHPRTIRSWIERGHLRAERVGPRLVRINAEDLDRMGAPVLDPAARLEEYVRRIVEEAPPLTDEQKQQIADLLRPFAAEAAS